LREQRTEEIKAVRVEIASEDVVNRLKALEQGQKEFKQETTKRLDAVQEDANILKIQMAGARADILQIRESQADLRDRLVEHSEDLKAIRDKQDAHSALLGQLINIGEETKATQAETKATQAEMKATQAEQGAKLDLILQLLQPKAE